VRSEGELQIEEHSGEGRALAQMPGLLTRLLLCQLRAVGMNEENKEGASSEGASDASAWLNALPQRIARPYARWLAQSLRVLASAGYVSEIEGGWRETPAAREIESAAVWEEWAQRTEEWGEARSVRAQVQLVEATLRALPGIVCGSVPATDIIFPASSLRLVEGIYRGNAVADYFNGVLAGCVAEYVARRVQAEPQVRLRILEVGAGTGGTSGVMFERLREYAGALEEYCYTDISKAFLLHAQATYGSWVAVFAVSIIGCGARDGGTRDGGGWVRCGDCEQCVACNQGDPADVADGEGGAEAQWDVDHE